MVASTDKKLSKTTFATEFLGENPTANPKAVSQAWTSAGHPGTVSEGLVNNLRSKLGLAGNLRTRPETAGSTGTAREPKARRESPAVETVKPSGGGKSAFIKEVLFDDPYANTMAVNKAWKAAGMDGSISESLVNSMRSEAGLAGNLRKGSKTPKGATASKLVTTKRAAREKTAPKSNGRKGAILDGARTKETRTVQAPGRKTRRADPSLILSETERDIDRIIYKLMEVGGFEGIEDALRTVRRMVARSHGA